MGSKNMDVELREYTVRHYAPGKRDLYAALILRCLDLCSSSGRVAMVTQQTWMFLSSYAELRAISEDQLREAGNLQRPYFGGILRDNRIEGLAHLGRYAFSEIGNAAVTPLLFVLHTTPPTPQHHIWACRLNTPKPSDEQAALLLHASRQDGFENADYVYRAVQASLVEIPNSPVLYSAPPEIIALLTSIFRLSGFCDAKQGLIPGDLAAPDAV